ncbi:MAG: PH domain-containing protein [Clostridiales bacterium]|nr:PH domain-containing protein [Clostridiales bacterium]
MENQVLLKIEPKVRIIDYLKWNIWMLGVAVVFFILTFIFGAIGINTLPEMEPLVNMFMGALRIIAVVLIPILYLYRTFVMYMHTGKISYKFYKDFVRFEDNFFNKNSKEILYKNITEVTTDQHVWGRAMNVGNIHIKTNVEISAGIKIPYVENPEQVVAQIRKIISEAENE